MATRQSAIRMKCTDCCAGDGTAIRCCTVTSCPLWGFRMGYGSERNRVCYDHDLYGEHVDETQEAFNRRLKEVQKHAR